MKEFRKYLDDENPVRIHYKKMRINQTYKHVLELNKTYLQFNKKIDIWNVINMLENFIDVSDPDINLPNAQHLYQTAEKIREDNLPDWLQLVGFIHDIGKILYIKGNDIHGMNMV